ncbi:hypothetical protein V3C99_008445, partial [Haemonchus contortus]
WHLPNCTGPASLWRQCREISHFFWTALRFCSTVLLKHTYYSDAIIEKACRIGLYGLVEDGVHDLQPDATNANGQLYTIHGFIASSVDVPLLFAVATR